MMVSSTPNDSARSKLRKGEGRNAMKRRYGRDCSLLARPSLSVPSPFVCAWPLANHRRCGWLLAGWLAGEASRDPPAMGSSEITEPADWFAFGF